MSWGFVCNLDKVSGEGNIEDVTLNKGLKEVIKRAMRINWGKNFLGRRRKASAHLGVRSIRVLLQNNREASVAGLRKEENGFCGKGMKGVIKVK